MNYHNLRFKTQVLLFTLMITSISLLALSPQIQATTKFETTHYTAKDYKYKAVVIAEGLNQPWSMVVLPGGTMLVAEKVGNIVRILADGTKQLAGSIKDVAVHGQGGLMDLTLHPDFNSNGLIYYSYTGRDKYDYGTRIGHFQWRNNKVTNQQEIFRATNLAGGGRHFGSRLVFDDQDHLYISLGDRGARTKSQNLNNHFGKVLRLDDSGTPVAANKFSNKMLPEIYSYGHRNPQGFVFAKGKLWLHEHGARGGDELNLISRGKNYGWPVITYGRDYSGLKIGEGTHKTEMEQPLVYWDPSIAPSGMILYEGKLFPAWQGDIFIGALAGTHLRRVQMRGTKVIHQEVLLDNIGRVREVAQDKPGHIYILTDSNNGQLIKLSP